MGLTCLLYVTWACNEKMDIRYMNPIGVAVKFVYTKMLILLVFS